MKAIRRSGMTNMLDRKVVGQIAQEMGFDEIADWIKVNRREYSEFILEGWKELEIPPMTAMTIQCDNLKNIQAEAFHFKHQKRKAKIIKGDVTV